MSSPCLGRHGTCHFLVRCCWLLSKSLSRPLSIRRPRSSETVRFFFSPQGLLNVFADCECFPQLTCSENFGRNEAFQIFHFLSVQQLFAQLRDRTATFFNRRSLPRFSFSADVIEVFIFLFCVGVAATSDDDVDASFFDNLFCVCCPFLTSKTLWSSCSSFSFSPSPLMKKLSMFSSSWRSASFSTSSPS